MKKRMVQSSKKNCQDTSMGVSGLQSWFLCSTITLLLLSIMGCATSGARIDKASDEGSGLVVYAHMANTTAAVQWALGAGVNAVEMDLQFQSDGSPQEFRHGGVCDCSCTDGCIIKPTCESGNVCYILWESGSSCNASVDADTMTKFLGSYPNQHHPNKLAVIYIDSKVDSGSIDLAAAGKAVIDLLDTNTFGGGFKGQVVISTPATEQIAYTKAAINAAKASTNREQYYFTIDNEGDNFLAVAKALVPLTENRGFSTGITACAPVTYYEAIELSALNEKNGVMSFTGIWTLNDESSMSTYLDDGANGLMTNIPSHALAALEAKGLKLAEPGAAFAPSTSNRIVTHLPD